MLLVFEDDEDHRTLDGEVTLVNRFRLDRMTPEQAGRRPGTTIEESQRGCGITTQACLTTRKLTL